MNSEIIKAVKRVRGGVLVSHQKNTADKAVLRLDAPETVVLPMRQHIGAPCVPTVKAGDRVKIGQIVGDSEQFVSTPIHASVSGKVVSVKETKIASGLVCPAVTIENDGEMALFEGLEPPKADTREELLAAIRASGLVGLGGAGFPTHVKLHFPADKPIDTLIINAAECEPYITVDYRECIENSWDILGGIEIIRNVLNISRVVIAVEDNKPEALRVLERIAATNDVEDHVKVMALKSKYPQGAEKMIVYSATGRKIPPGGLPSDVGCVVMNVASVAFAARYIKTGKPLVSRSLTVDGSAIKNPQNVRVPVGTGIDYILEKCGGFTEEPVKIIAGGPMMGMAITDTHHPILKSNNALLAFGRRENPVKPETDCIRCGRCASACPLSLMPSRIEDYAVARNVEKLEHSGAMVCMECGSCAYSCPAGKPLVQYMRLAKEILREERAKNGK